MNITSQQSNNNPSKSGGIGTQSQSMGGSSQGTAAAQHGTGSQDGGRSNFADGNSGNSVAGTGLSGQKEAREHTEGPIAKTLEDQTAKLPSDTFLWAAVGGMAVSAVMEFTGHKDKSRFFGQWVAPLLLFGVYNKLVKVAGSDRRSDSSIN